MRVRNLLTCFLSLFTMSSAFGDNCEEALVSKTTDLKVETGASFRLSDVKGKAHWDVRWHLNLKGELELLAFDKDRLSLKLFNLASEEPTTHQFRSQQRSSVPPTLISTSGGEVLVGQVEKGRHLHIYSTRRAGAYTIDFAEPLKQIRFHESNSGVYLVAQTLTGFDIYHADRQGFRLMASWAANGGRSPIRDLQVISDSYGRLILTAQTMDQSVNVLRLEGEKLNTLSRFVYLGRVINPTITSGNEIILALLDTGLVRDQLQFYFPESKHFTRIIDVHSARGRGDWIQYEGQTYFAIPAREKSGRVLTLKRPEDATVHYVPLDQRSLDNVRAITSFSSFQLGGKDYLVVLENHTRAFVQTPDGEQIDLPGPTQTRLTQVSAPIKVGKDLFAVAVVGEGPKGTRAQVYYLTSAHSNGR